MPFLFDLIHRSSTNYIGRYYVGPKVSQQGEGLNSTDAEGDAPA
jgi:hypothetical protein